MKDKNLYDEIVKKLGFEPKDYIFNQSHTENDQSESPFSILTLDELRFLQNNNYFRTTNR
ncbi:MAG: hypothetical protein ACI4EK_02980 [Wujia sp.]